VSIVAKRALFAALTVIGLVVLVVGAWFTVHLGSSGSATFRAAPASGAVVVVEPSVLNRVDRPVSVTAVAKAGTKIWMGRSSPVDAQAIIGGADRISVTGTQVRDWRLVQSRAGAGTAPPLAPADIWRQTASGQGRVHMNLDQTGAPESVVIAGPDGKPVELTSLTVTVERHTWFFQALLATLVGLLAALAGAAGLWQHRPRVASSEPEAKPQDEPGSDTPSQEESA
jgi:protein-S-isoprenylcysteine O-methyltransferase Ste14